MFIRDAGVWGATAVVAGGVAYFVWNYLSTGGGTHQPSGEEETTKKSEKCVKEDFDGTEDVKSEEVVVNATAPAVVAVGVRELLATVPETVKQPEEKAAEKFMKSVKEDEEGTEDVKREEIVVVAANAPAVVAVEAKGLSATVTVNPPEEKAVEKSVQCVKEDDDGTEDVKNVVAVEAKELLATVQTNAVKPRGTQVLVLGLDGAGKTSLLRSFTNSCSEQETQPTQGFNAVSINKEDLSIEFVEIGGSVGMRQYWQKYMPKALMLVFVVDSSNPQLFSLAKTHLHELLVTDLHLPLMVLANKQDCAGACSITDLHDALSLSEVGDRKMFVIGTYVQKQVQEPSSGVEDALMIIIQTINESR